MSDESGVTVIVRRYRGDPGSATVTSGDMSGAGALDGSDVLSDAEMGLEDDDWNREHHPDADGDQPILVKAERVAGLQSAEELQPGDHTDSNARLPGARVEFYYPNGDAKAIANAEIIACWGAVPDSQNPYRVPIQREVDDTRDESDPDHIRGARYANLLFGTDYGAGDAVEVVYLDRIGDGFFQRAERRQPELADSALYRHFKRDLSEGEAVVCVDNTDLLPPEFSRDPAKSPGAGQ